MAIQVARPALSVVIEWENAKNSASDRASAMLRNLVRQLEAERMRLRGPAELILVHDAEETTASDVLLSVQPELAGFSGTVRTIPVDRLDYYQQKTTGASQASGDAILFVDSDIIPAPGWLSSLLDCYLSEEADVVGGTTCISADSLYSKTFALFWFFPLERDAGARRRTDHFFANNVIFRASVFRDHPFPESNLVRGNCVQLAHVLQEHQKSIFIEPKAYVDHPPPNGIKHFVNRALCQGHDNVILDERRSALRALRRCAWRVVHSTRRILGRRDEVGLSLAATPAALCIAAAYNGIELAGELITLASGPERHLIRNHCRV